MSAWRQNLSRDELNRCWDAVVGRDPGAPSDGDSDDVALLRRFHALDTAPPPSPGFFADLERQFATLPPASVAMRKSVRASGIATSQNPRLAGSKSILKPHRWASTHSALAVLSIMLVVSLLVLYQAVPGPSEPPPIPAAVIAKPSIEPITQFEFVPPLWGVPDATAWNHMEIGMFRVAPATSFTTNFPWYTSADGPLSLTVLSGELTVTPAGPAFFYPANQSSQPPVAVSAGKSVSIGPNDTVAYSSVETAAGINTGREPALVLYELVGYQVHQQGTGSQPKDVSFVVWEYINPIPTVPTSGAALTLQRLELAPFDTFVFEPDAGLRYLALLDPYQTRGLRIAEGALEGIVPQSDTQAFYGGAKLRYLKPGPHTILNLGDQTVDIYFLIVDPAPAAATPTP